MSEYTKFIDSVVGNIARKIEDEFNESDHPRDKSGKFTSKGGEGKGGRNPLDEDKKQKRYENAMAKAKKENPSWSRKDLETYGRGLAKKLEKDLIPETETEKAAKEELNASKGKNKKLASKLKEIASDGFSEYPDMAQDFLKTMGVKLPRLSREEKEYYEEYPDEYQDLIMEKVNSAIERDPEAAKEALGEWADED